MSLIFSPFESFEVENIIGYPIFSFLTTLTLVFIFFFALRVFGTFYWHFVDVIWILLFIVLYFMPVLTEYHFEIAAGIPGPGGIFKVYDPESYAKWVKTINEFINPYCYRTGKSKIKQQIIADLTKELNVTLREIAALRGQNEKTSEEGLSLTQKSSENLEKYFKRIRIYIFQRRNILTLINSYGLKRTPPLNAALSLPSDKTLLKHNPFIKMKKKD